MMKKYNSLFITVASLLVVGLSASGKSFFDKPTENVIEKAAKFYAVGFCTLYGAGKTLQVLSGAPLFPLKTIDPDVLYNDTFPKDHYPQSVVQRIAAKGARGRLPPGGGHHALL